MRQGRRRLLHHMEGNGLQVRTIGNQGRQAGDMRKGKCSEMRAEFKTNLTAVRQLEKVLRLCPTWMLSGWTGKTTTTISSLAKTCLWIWTLRSLRKMFQTSFDFNTTLKTSLQKLLGFFLSGYLCLCGSGVSSWIVGSFFRLLTSFIGRRMP